MLHLLQYGVVLNYSGACIHQTPIEPEICSTSKFDLKPLIE